MEPGYGVHTPSHTAHGSATFGTGRAARFSCAFCVRRFVPESLQDRKQKLETWHDNWIIVLTQVISTVGRNTRSSPLIACIWVVAAKLDIRHLDENTHFFVAIFLSLLMQVTRQLEELLASNVRLTMIQPLQLIFFTKQEQANMKTDAGFPVWCEFRNQVHVIPFHGRSPDQGEKL